MFIFIKTTCIYIYMYACIFRIIFYQFLIIIRKELSQIRKGCGTGAKTGKYLFLLSCFTLFCCLNCKATHKQKERGRSGGRWRWIWRGRWRGVEAITCGLSYERQILMPTLTGNAICSPCVTVCACLCLCKCVQSNEAHKPGR